MHVDTAPDFTPTALHRWKAIPSESRKRLLTNVWCVRCRHEVTMNHYSGTLRDANLLLVGRCAECHGDVAAVIEAR